MPHPVIYAAAAVMLIPSLAPSIGPIPCQTDARITRAAEATDMERADPHRLAGMRPVQPASHMTVRWRGGWHHHRRCVRVGHHWRCR
jgi:hypothetical protein